MTSAPVVSITGDLLSEIEEGCYESVADPYELLSEYAAELRRLRSEVQALRADAWRYRWTFDNCEASSDIHGIFEGQAQLDTAMQSNTEGN